MRIDRFLTLYLFSQAMKIARSRMGLRVPILMYHSISDEEEKGVGAFFKINTSQRVFSEHMRYLHDSGYQVISLSDTVDLINQAKKVSRPHGPSSSSRYVVLTFDDGYRDFNTDAFPILRKYGFRATVFLPTSFIDQEGRVGLKGKEHLNWREVGELQKEGIIFGSHTVSHPQLKTLRKNEIEYEVRRSKEQIEDKISTPADSFAYPCAFPQEDGEFKKYIARTLEGFGYKQGVTTIIGRSCQNDNYCLLKRIPINSDDDLCFFKAKLEGGYDWLIHPQHLYKRLYKIMRA